MGPLQFAPATGGRRQTGQPHRQFELMSAKQWVERRVAMENDETVVTETIAAAVQTVERGMSSSRSDLLAIEEPLQICLNGSPLSITMRTPGADLDLAAGFLFTEGIVYDIGQILSMC